MCLKLARSRSLLALLALCAAALIAAGCGLTSGAGSQANSSPPTIAGGLVTIATDHSTYAPTDGIHVTVVNHLTTSISAYDTRASCSILGLQVMRDGTWQSATVARCPLGRVALPVKIAPGGSYSATITAGYKGQPGAMSFPDGQYRLVLSYSAPGTPASTLAPNGPPPGAGTTTVYSATLSVSGSAPGASGGSSGTPTLSAEPGTPQQ